MEKSQTQEPLIYTTTYKAFNLETESSSIQLADTAWIEYSLAFINEPSSFSPSMLMFSGVLDDPQYNLSKFYQPLLKSPLRLRVTHTQEQFDANPFPVHECTHIAIALAILCDPWFVVGIESFGNSRDTNNPSLGPYMSYFLGNKTKEPAKIMKKDEAQLIRIYDFVYRQLAMSSWESESTKLLLLFVHCVTRTPYQRFSVLKLGLDHLFTEFHATILNAALFFENLFTNESGNRINGIKAWNRLFQTEAHIDEDIVNLIFQYRHLVAHSNPTRAKNSITQWKKESGLNDLDAIEIIREGIWNTAKICLRAIIDNETKFHDFLKTRPD